VIAEYRRKPVALDDSGGHMEIDPKTVEALELDETKINLSTGLIPMNKYITEIKCHPTTEQTAGSPPAS
jgi:hypothetical protein